MNSRQKVALAFVAILWVGWQVFLLVSEYKRPATDVFLFKEAGVNLALKGRFTVSDLPHMPADLETLYFYYPPVYPFLFGVWSKVFGVGLQQSLVFDLLVRLARTLLLFLFLLPLFQKKRRWLPWGIGFLGLLAVLSSDGDRPDDLAIFFGLASLILWRRDFDWRKTWMVGTPLGLCGATSPTAGILFAMLGVADLWVRKRSFFSVPLVGVSALLIFLACTLPIQNQEPMAAELFAKQVPLSTFPYKIPFVDGATFDDFRFTYKDSALHSIRNGGPYVFSAVLFLFVGLISILTRKSNAWRPYAHLLFVPTFFMIAIVVVWTLQPYYMWFAIMALVLFGWVQILQANSKQKEVALFVGLCLSLVPLVYREAKAVGHSLQQPESQNRKTVASRVLELVEPNAKLAVTPDQYFSFRPFRSLANAGYVCDRIDEFTYLYASPPSSRRDRTEPVPFPCRGKGQCFEVVADLTSRKVFTLFGNETPFFVKGNGGILYKNTQCNAKEVADAVL